MENKKIIFSIFLLVVFVQLFVPVKIIYDSEEIISNGTEFKFRTAPIDPIDPFRGKYIFLQFKENTVNVESEKDWKIGESIFALIENDKNGFAKIKSIEKTEPLENLNFVNVKITSIFQNKIIIQYPFNRFYMEETKAGKAETIYNNSIFDTTKITYALVSIKNGNSIIQNIFVDDVPINNFLQK
ncbi:MAG: GDYXXLXY domain-containing protein [Ignavibacteriae bacterium]|nr:GDYXXLXY domain-containing protein [Ignavibacteriota bacterium]